MKRILAFLCVILLIISLVSCKNEPQNALDSSETSSKISEETTANTTNATETTSETSKDTEATSDTTQETEKTTETTSDTEKPTNFMLSSDTAQEFSLIRPMKCTFELTECVDAFNSKLYEFGFSVNKKTDYIQVENQIPENEPAILVGETNRSASTKYYKSLKVDDYIIAVEGNQLVIAGGSDAATQKAVEYFIENYIKSSKGMLIFNDGVLKSETGSYRISDLTLCGKSISEYEIVIPRYASAACTYAASLIGQRITDASGHIVKVVNENKTTGKSQIHLNYKNSSLNDTEYMFNKTENGFEISATERSLLYAVRKMTDTLTNTKITTPIDITPELSKKLTMDISSQSLPTSLKGKTPIGLCDQKNNQAVVIDLSAKDPTSSSAVLWEWTPSSSNGFKNGFKSRIDELKLRYSPTLKKHIVLATSSSGFIGMAEYPSGNKIWETYASGFGPHSIEYLPNGLVACALSGNGDESKCEIRLYAVNSKGVPTETYIKDGLSGAHAVMWDDEFGVLWALGNSVLVAYEISGTPQAPVMTRIDGLGGNIGGGGHDLSRSPSDNGMFWFSCTEVKTFDKYKNIVISNFDGNDMISTTNVKAIGALPDGRIVRAAATGVYAAHNTDTLSVFTPKGDGTYTQKNYVFKNRAFYKARPFLLY